MQIINVTREATVVAQGRVADDFFSRLRGLMGAPPLAAGEGLLILPCNSIHTQFMRFPIDVLYVSKAGEVVAVDECMAPWRFGRIRKGSRFVVELPAGTISASGTQVGDRVAVTGYDTVTMARRFRG